MPQIKSYRDLIVWQKAHELALKTYSLCSHFPKNDEAFIVKKQLLRSTLSIAANIVEGFGGHKGKAYKNYLIISRRSLSESDYWLLFAMDVRLLDDSEYNDLKSLLNEVHALLNSIINTMNDNLKLSL